MKISGNAKIIIGLHLVSRGSFIFGIAFGWIIKADLISGEQTRLNVGKTVFHFVSRGSSILGSKCRGLKQAGKREDLLTRVSTAETITFSILV